MCTAVCSLYALVYTVLHVILYHSRIKFLKNCSIHLFDVITLEIRNAINCTYMQFVSI